MDKLRRALSGNEVEDEESGIVSQVHIFVIISLVVSTYYLLPPLFLLDSR